jgi:hypothetical protein
MEPQKDYWLSLAVYDAFRGVPVRKIVARGYLDLRTMDRSEQSLFIRLGSLFFQGRSWRKFVGDSAPNPIEQLDPSERAELTRLLATRAQVGAAVVRLLDDDETLSPLRRDITIERLETMGFLDTDYKI